MCMQFKKCLICILLLGSVLAFTQNATAQCLRVAIFIGSAVKKKSPARVNAGVAGAIYVQNGSGGIALNSSSTIGYAAAVKKQATAQVAGTVTSVAIDGDITGTFKRMVISGTGSYPTKDRGVVPAVLQVSALNLKRKKKQKNGLVSLSGKTTVRIIDSTTGKVIYNQKPCKFSKLCTFAYQWEQGSCNPSTPGPNPPVKR